MLQQCPNHSCMSQKIVKGDSCAAAEALALCRPTKLRRQQWPFLQGVRYWRIVPVLVVPLSDQKAERVFRAEKHACNSGVSSSKTKQ